jgi:hypothetical protein
MKQGSAEISDKVTILVFKDNFAARTFQISLKWISKLGLLLALLVGLTIGSLFVAIKYYRITLELDPARIQDLEQEIAELKNAAAKNSGNKPVDANTQSDSNKPLTPSSPSAPSASVSPTLFFSTFPTLASTSLPDAASLPFTVSNLSSAWHGKILQLRFHLHYTKEDKGSQHGKLLILARGPDSLLVYPPGAFNPIGEGSLVSIEKSESFSVSKAREVKAEFGPVHSQKAIKELEIYIFNHQNQILKYQKISLQKPKSPEAPSTPGGPDHL